MWYLGNQKEVKDLTFIDRSLQGDGTAKYTGLRQCGLCIGGAVRMCVCGWSRGREWKECEVRSQGSDQRPYPG